MASRAGSLFSYSPLWLILIPVIAKAVQVYTGARYMTLTGHHPLEHWAHFPGPPKWIPIMMLVLSLWCFPPLLAFLTLILGEIVNEMFHVVAPDQKDLFWFWARLWATIASIVAITLTLLQSYRVIETMQTVVVGLLLASIGAACIASNPDWIEALIGTFIPTVPEYPPWVLEKYTAAFTNRTAWIEAIAMVGFIGGGTYDYLGYVGCLREKAWGAIGQPARHASYPNECKELAISIDQENVRRARLWLRPVGIDVWVSFFCVFVFSVFFVVLGAAILHPQQLVPAKNGELLTHQAQFLTRLHPSLLYIYQIGVFMAFWGTIYGAYEIYTRTLYECLRPLSEGLKNIEPQKLRVMVLAYCGFLGIFLCWMTENPIRLMTFPSLIGGVFACGLWCFGMIWLDYKFLPQPLRMNKTLVASTIVSGLLLAGLGLKGLSDYFWPWVKFFFDR